MGKIGRIYRVAILLGRLKFHDLRAVIKNRPYIVFAFFVLISKQPECRYCDGTVIEKTN